MAVSSRWLGAYRCQVEIRDFEISVDEPPDQGGEDTGPTPTELLLGSAASCFTLAIAHVARKHHKRLEDLVVTAEGEYDGPRFSRIELAVSAGIPTDEIEWLAARAIRVCYVSNTLGCTVTYTVV